MVRSQSWADFTTTTPELKFSVHTAAFSASSRVFDLNGEVKAAKPKHKSQIFRQLRRFHHVINPDSVFGTHRSIAAIPSGVTKERPPSLRARNPPPHHIFGHAGLADIDPKLEKLAMEPRGSPQRIATLIWRISWRISTVTIRSSAAVLRFPSPIRSKSRTVPTDYGLGSDDCKGAIQLGKPSAGASQYQPVNRNKPKPLRISASQHIDLLP